VAVSAKTPRLPLTADEKRAIVVAAESVFLKIANMHDELRPIFVRYGFRMQSAGVVSRDISEKIEEQIVLHCKTCTRDQGFSDLGRHGQRWEVKIAKGKGLTINQSSQIRGENYIVVNYLKHSALRRVWVLWEAEDQFFTPLKPHLNLRTILSDVAAACRGGAECGPFSSQRLDTDDFMRLMIAHMAGRWIAKNAGTSLTTIQMTSTSSG
jgi:hypothetical protein